MDSRDQNPFASPQAEQVPAPARNVEIDQDMVRRFRSECLALAVFWVAMGAGCALLASFLWPDSGRPSTLYAVYSFALGVIGVSLFLLGLAAFFYVIRAVKAAFWFTLALVVLPPIWFSVFGIMLTVLAILQARRVIRWADALEAANLPLSIKPAQVLDYRRRQLAETTEDSATVASRITSADSL